MVFELLTESKRGRMKSLNKFNMFIPTALIVSCGKNTKKAKTKINKNKGKLLPF